MDRTIEHLTKTKKGKLYILTYISCTYIHTTFNALVIVLTHLIPTYIRNKKRTESWNKDQVEEYL